MKRRERRVVRIFPLCFGGNNGRAKFSLGEKPGVRAVEWSESRERGDGNVEMGLQSDVVAAKREQFGIALKRSTKAQ